MRWINTTQQQRDHVGLRGVCAADGHEFTPEDPEVLTDDGFRVHQSDVTDPNNGFYGHQQ